jgi:hypothetical protein
MDGSGHRALVERYLAAYNGFDVDAMLALLAPGVRFENHSGGRLTAQADGIAQFRALAEQACTLFAEREQRLLGLDLAPAAATARIARRGRLAVDLPDGPPAGTELALEGTTEFHFDGDRIAAIIDRG